jgi:outer membrane lipoprotein-sorting protein
MNSSVIFRITTWVFVLSILIGYSTSGFAQYPSYKAVSNIEQFKKDFKQTSAKVQSVQADFTQLKTLSALTEEISSTGKMWFKRASKVRMDYTKPFVYKLVINNEKMLISDGGKENRINVKSNKLFKQINQITVDCMQGTILESTDFKSRVFESENAYLLELTPQSKSLKEFFTSIILVTDKKDSSAKSIELNEPTGDKTVLTFSNKIINGQVGDEVFSF